MKTLARVLACISLVLISFSIQAQEFHLGLHVEPSMPFGDDIGDMGLGFGGKLSARYYSSDHLSTGLEIGYTQFSDSEEGHYPGVGSISASVDFSFISIEPAVMYHTGINKPAHFFIGTGVGITAANVDTEASIGGFSGASSNSSSGFSASPRMGAGVALSSNFNLDLQLGYHLIFIDGANPSYASANLGFTVALN